MATDEPVRIHRAYKGRLYLREHRRNKKLSAKTVGGRVGKERESVLRIEREPWRLDTEEKQREWAEALGVALEELRRPPGAPWAPSIDDLIKDKPVDVQLEAYDLVKRFIKRA